MPRNAIAHVEIDHVVRGCELAPLLIALAAASPAAPEKVTSEVFRMVSDLTCPECRGRLWEEHKGSLVEYRCRVGHTFSEQHMIADHNGAQERALYAAIVALEEGAVLARHLAERQGADRDKLLADADEKERSAKLLRTVVGENALQTE